MNWLFTDMNSYFASVEQAFRPELRGRPVAVVPVESENTSVIAASFEAKKLGVKMGTRVGDARALCPGLVLVQARPKFYVEIHHQLLESVDHCAPIHKVYSIDEWSVRLVKQEQTPAGATALARQIKAQIRKDFGPWMTCSIGIAPSRLLAKIASDLNKPDGLTILDPRDLPGPLEHLTLKSLCGIGEAMLNKLNRFGVHDVRQLWNLSRQQAIEAWGSRSGGDWWAGFHGIDEPEAATKKSSMSHEKVLGPEERNEKSAYGIFVRLTSRLGMRLRLEGYVAGQLSMRIKDLGPGRYAAESKLPQIDDTSTLLWHMSELWRKRGRGVDRPLKIGVVVSDLVPKSLVADSLLEPMRKLGRLSEAMDRINRRCGPLAIYAASMHEHRGSMENKIAFGRIPGRNE